MKPCILFVDIMKLCMWSFGAAVKGKRRRGRHKKQVWEDNIKEWTGMDRKIIGTNDFFRPCVHCVVVKEMRMWSFDGIYLNFVTIKAF